MVFNTMTSFLLHFARTTVRCDVAQCGISLEAWFRVGDARATGLGAVCSAPSSKQSTTLEKSSQRTTTSRPACNSDGGPRGHLLEMIDVLGRILISIIRKFDLNSDADRLKRVWNQSKFSR